MRPCTSNCLLRNDGFDCKQRVEGWLDLPANNFAIDWAGFTVLDNHLHLLVRLDSDRVKDWADEEVMRRRLAINMPPTGRRVAVSGTNFYMRTAGKMTREWEQMDSLGTLQQLGVLPPT